MDYSKSLLVAPEALRKLAGGEASLRARTTGMQNEASPPRQGRRNSERWHVIPAPLAPGCVPFRFGSGGGAQRNHRLISVVPSAQSQPYSLWFIRYLTTLTIRAPGDVEVLHTVPVGQTKVDSASKEANPGVPADVMRVFEALGE